MTTENKLFTDLCAEALSRAGLEVTDAEQTRVLGLSEFLVRMAQRDPVEFQTWLAASEYTTELTAERIDVWVAHLAAQVALDEEQESSGPLLLARLQQHIRTLRNRVQRIVIWRHLSRRASVTETTHALSTLADGLVQVALDASERAMIRSEGEPLDEAGERQHLVVFALGKLGGRELNLSSDIDLICAYPHSGKTGKSGKTNQQFFVQVVQRLVKALSETTTEGFGFRVDLRLRPYGDSGPIVQPFAAMERYFETSGRDWERYALIKARPCAGSIAAGEELLERLRPFVYRRYLDFAAIAAMRDMCSLIRRDHEAHSRNVKLGAGGIRDIEFLAQMLQLIWGGRVPGLRTNSLAAALDALVGEQLLSVTQRATLWECYVKFRNAEHVLQAIRDEQTHSLPENEIDQLRLALALGHDSYAEFEAELQAARGAVLECAGQWLDVELSNATVSDGEDSTGTAGAQLWALAEHTRQSTGARADAGPELELHESLAGRSVQIVRELRNAAERDPEGVVLSRLDALMPGLLGDVLSAVLQCRGRAESRGAERRHAKRVVDG